MCSKSKQNQQKNQNQQNWLAVPILSEATVHIVLTERVLSVVGSAEGEMSLLLWLISLVAVG